MDIYDAVGSGWDLDGMDDTHYCVRRPIDECLPQALGNLPTEDVVVATMPVSRADDVGCPIASPCFSPLTQTYNDVVVLDAHGDYHLPESMTFAEMDRNFPDLKEYTYVYTDTTDRVMQHVVQRDRNGQLSPLRFLLTDDVRLTTPCSPTEWLDHLCTFVMDHGFRLDGSLWKSFDMMIHVDHDDPYHDFIPVHNMLSSAKTSDQ